MKELFAKSRSIDTERCVRVTELPDDSIAIEGLTLEPHGEVARGAIRLSPESAEQVRQLLNDWRDVNPEAFDDCPF